MKKKILTILVIGWLLTTTATTIGAVTFNQKEKDVELTLLNGNCSPHCWYFTPCDPIEIEGYGIVIYSEDEKSMDILFFNNGNVKLNNEFDYDYDKSIITCDIEIINFTGTLDDDGNPLTPFSVSGSAEIVGLCEESQMVDISHKDIVNLGNNIPVKLKNKRIENLEITKSTMLVYRLGNHQFDLIYEEVIDDDLLVGPLSSKNIWSWDQTDQDGNAVTPGSYGIYGLFEINGREHPTGGQGLYIEKSRNRLVLSFLSQLLDVFPFLKQILNL